MRSPGQSGFTILETLVSIGIVTILFGMSVPIYLQFQTRNDLDGAVRTYVQAARRAQQLAQSSDNSSGWGVKYQTGGIKIYRAATDSAGTVTFATRLSAADDTLVVPTTIAPSGSDEINFTYLTGAVSSATGTLTLTGSGGITRTVTFNAKGMINWQ